MQDILVILLCIGIGMVVGWRRRRDLPLLRLAGRVSLYAVYALLFILGNNLGSDAALLAQLPVLGGKALVIALCCTGGSVISLIPARRFFPEPRAERPTAAGSSDPSPLWGSLRILCCFALGALLGFLHWTPAWMNDSELATWALYFLVFAVGIGLGADFRAFGVIRDMQARILAVPLLIIAGTAAGALLAFALLPGASLKDTVSCGAGFGYYSLSSILIEQSGDSALASVALLSNILREMMGILAAPLLARHLGRLTPVGAAGATAMDTGLPVIARFCGERAAVIAVFSGMTLTLLVPFLVAAALRFL
jgi:uncharacterized membrane protein YbjE (DUF340 family)